METASTLEPVETEEEIAAIRAQLRQMLTQLEESNRRMADDQVEIDRLRRESRQLAEETAEIRRESLQIAEETRRLAPESHAIAERTRMIGEESRQILAEAHTINEETRRLFPFMAGK